MDTKKLQELLYDIQRNKDLDNIHDLIIEYTEEEQKTQAAEIIVGTVSMDLFQKGDKKVEMRMKLEVPIEMMRLKFWTIENVLA